MKTVDRWQEENIGEQLRLLIGFPFPSSKFSNEEGFPLVRIRDVVESNVETYYLGDILPMYLIKKGDVLIGMDGDFHLAKWKGQDALLNQRVLKLDVYDPDKLDIEFIYYWLQPYVKKINELTAATTVKHLSTKDLRKAKGEVPSSTVQRRIGKILNTVDQAIASTEALIEKYQHIKAGLMHDLFTRGIGADSKLRPTQEEAPELYQESAIGWIPKEWTCISASKICFPITKGTTPSTFEKSHTKESIPYLRVENLSFDGSLKIDASSLFVSKQIHNSELLRSKVYPNDILMNIVGSGSFRQRKYR